MLDEEGVHEALCEKLRRGIPVEVGMAACLDDPSQWVYMSRSSVIQGDRGEDLPLLTSRCGVELSSGIQAEP